MSGLSDKIAGTLGCLFGIAMALYGILIVAVGWVGIDVEFGPWWGFAAGILAVVFRITLPITLGAIFGAMHLWGWHWIGATVFALPGLIFMIPALFAFFISLFSKR